MIFHPTRFLASYTLFRFTHRPYIHRPQHYRMPRVTTLTCRDLHESEVAQHLLIFVPDHFNHIPPLLRRADLQSPRLTRATPREVRDHLALGLMRMVRREIVARIQTVADSLRI